MKEEVHRLRFERQRLVELGNSLRAKLRVVDTPQEPFSERKKLLEAALRALLSENRKLQQELEASVQSRSSGEKAAGSGEPSKARLASRGGKTSAGVAFGETDDPDELSQVLQLHGAAPARSSLAGLPSGPGYLRQPLTEELRRPRSATDRGTESQRKALERLRAAQAKHDEAAAAADEQRRKVLPLIRWRDSATAAAQQGNFDA
ncbi:unnamed protein product [Durusdinium trenchii]|uniref:Uncharacterized protein n=1 Tax=Durusdinium trenchii TaxID=1381693 RepID=A0ABP0RAE9_9DINO